MIPNNTNNISLEIKIILREIHWHKNFIGSSSHTIIVFSQSFRVGLIYLINCNYEKG